MFDLVESELDLKLVSVVDFVSNLTVELKPDPRSKMASPIDIATQFFQDFFELLDLQMMFY